MEKKNNLTSIYTTEYLQEPKSLNTLKKVLRQAHEIMYAYNRKKKKVIEKLLPVHLKNILSGKVDEFLSENPNKEAINKQDKDGWVVLMTVSILGSEKQALSLIHKGANVNIQDKEGRTPLMFSACFGNENVLDILIKNGADFSIKDKNGKKACDYADEYGNKRIMEKLQETGNKDEIKNKNLSKTVLTQIKNNQLGRD